MPRSATYSGLRRGIIVVMVSFDRPSEVASMSIQSTPHKHPMLEVVRWPSMAAFHEISQTCKSNLRGKLVTVQAMMMTMMGGTAHMSRHCPATNEVADDGADSRGWVLC